MAARSDREVDFDPESSVIPSFLSGELDGVRPDTVLAVAVNGRVRATTRAYREGGRTLFAALVPPSSLRAGENAIGVFDAALRPVG